MNRIKQINIKNRRYYIFNDMINIEILIQIRLWSIKCNARIS